MRKKVAVTAFLVAVVGALMVVPFRLGNGPDGIAHASALQPFDGCDGLLSYLKERARESVTPYGLGGDGLVHKAGVLSLEAAPASGATVPSGASAAAEFSRTNVQEAGVDEPDIVKTDGKHLFTVADGTLHAVDLRDGTARSVGSLKLEGQGHELLLADDRLLVLSSVDVETGLPDMPAPDGEARIQSMVVAPTVAHLAEVDVSDPAKMRVIRTLQLDGNRGAARLIGYVVRVVVHSNMQSALKAVHPTSGDEASSAEALTENRRLIDASRIEDWLPRYTSEDLREGGDGREEGALVECARAHRPPEPAGLGMTSVVSIDLSKGLQVGRPTAVVTGSDHAYASAESLYIATAHWVSTARWETSVNGVRVGDAVSPETSPEPWTSVHRFDLLGDGEAEYRSSGRVDGTVKDQWSFSEHDGFLRVTTTEQRTGGVGTEMVNETETGVSVLAEREEQLVEVGRVGGLGRGEQVYAVRYIGNLGYVVTFLQTDPLYVIDLSKPSAPRVAGELKIPGFSSYLHPLDDGKLLGLGQDATEQGQTLGTQLSIFDVSDPARPTRVTKVGVGEGSNSLAEGDHRAFLYWEPSGLVVVPIQQWSPAIQDFAQPPVDGVPLPLDESSVVPGQNFSGVMAFKVDPNRAELSEAGRVSHPTSESYGVASIERSIVVGDRLLTLSQIGLMVNALDDLKQLTWIAW